MKKFFTFFAALMAVVVVNATVVTLSPSDFSAATSAATSASKDGVSAAVTSGTITADQIRIFKNQTITISSEKEISGIVFTCTANGDAQYGPGCFEAQAGYSYDGKIGTWVGTATEVAFKAASNQVRATKIQVYLDGETPGDPTPQETIKVDVAGAIAAGMALDSAKTSEALYEVTGFVVNSQPYNPTYKNQIWFMADDAENAGAQEFEAYACTVSEDNVTMQVLDGDKVTLTGNITKYYDKNNSKFIIEIKDGTAVFVSKTEGDHSISGDTPAQGVDTITVVKALEIGNALASGAVSDKEYVVKGYVSSIQDYFSEQYKNETFFITDTKGARTSDKTQAFEVYRGKPNTGKEIGLDALIQIKCKIKNYNGTIENDGVNLSFEVLEQGGEVKVDTVTVSEALEIGNALADNAYTDNPYVVIGYVTKAYDPDEGKTQQNFYMADYPDDRGDFYAYKANPDSKISDGDYIQLFGKIQKYVGQKGTTIELSYGTATHLEAPKVDTIAVTVAQAVAVGSALPEGEKTEDVYAVTGIVISIVGEYENGVQRFFIADDGGADMLYAFNAHLDAAVEVGRKVELIGRLQNEAEVVTIENGNARIIWPEGIENIELTEKVQKVVVDGAVYVVRDGKLFNLQGAQVR